MATKDKLRVAFIHPDLGIGGAEQLVVNLALALIKQGHEAVIYTPYHNKSFPETHNGTIQVKVHGSFFSLIPRSIFGRFLALLAYIRTIFCCIHMILFDLKYDVVVCDLVSAVVPILRLFGYKTIFYCHHPDKLLAPQGGGIIKRIYRFFIDIWQEVSLYYANKIFVNSEYTRSVFEKNFKLLSKAKVKTNLLYPSVDFSKFDVQNTERIFKQPYFISLNRYERKKNINLAIKAFAKMKQTSEKSLVIAGGYDPRVIQNVEHYQQLRSLAKQLGVQNNVKFLKNITDNQKVSLLKNTLAVLYTPQNEHFGIVPCQAMYCQVPVIACNNGGPIESVENNKTGYLIDSNDKSIDRWSQCMDIVFQNQNGRKQMGKLGKKRTIKMFGFQSFSEQFIDQIKKTIK